MTSVLHRMLSAALLIVVAGISGPACSARTTPAQRNQEQADVAAREQARKTIVARVNGSSITMDALIRMMNRLAMRASEAPAPEQTEEVRQAALDRLVLQELALQQARSRNIAPDPKNVDTAIANLMTNLGGSHELEEFLAKESVTEQELRAQVERSLTIELIFAREVLDKIVIPEDKVRAEYQKEKQRYVLPEKVLVTDVAFLQKENSTAARKQAEQVLKKIKADTGKDPWKLVLDGTFIVRSMELRRDREPQLHAAAKKLKPGGLSGVVRSGDGYHIIKLKSYEPSRQLRFDEVRASLEQKFRVPQQEARLAQWEQELKKDAVIEIFDQTMAVRKSEGNEAKR